MEISNQQGTSQFPMQHAMEVDTSEQKEARVAEDVESDADGVSHARIEKIYK